MAVYAPLFELVRTAGNVIFRLRPFVAEFLDCGAVDGIGELLNQHVGEIRHRRGERELQRFLVQSLHAQRFGLGLAQHDFLGVDHFAVGQIAGVGRAGFRCGKAAEAVHEIVGGNRFAVRPFGIAQMESPDFVAVAFPFFCQCGNGFAGGVGVDQAVHHLADECAGGHVAAFLRIERAGFDGVADDDAFVVLALEFRGRDDGFPAAGGKGEAAGRRQGGQGISVCGHKRAPLCGFLFLLRRPPRRVFCCGVKSECIYFLTDCQIVLFCFNFK